MRFSRPSDMEYVMFSTGRATESGRMPSMPICLTMTILKIRKRCPQPGIFRQDGTKVA